MLTDAQLIRELRQLKPLFDDLLDHAYESGTRDENTPPPDLAAADRAQVQTLLYLLAGKATLIADHGASE